MIDMSIKVKINCVLGRMAHAISCKLCKEHGIVFEGYQECIILLSLLLAY